MSRLTLRDVIEMVKDKDINLVAGKENIDNEVTKVSVMEVPDIARWITGGELIISSFFALKDSVDDQLNLIKTFKEKNVAGLIVKVKRFIPAIPTQVAELAKTLEFPLLEVGPEFMYSWITDPVMNRLFNLKATFLIDQEEKVKIISQMKLNGSNLQQLIIKLCELVNNYISIHNRIPIMYGYNNMEKEVYIDQEVKENLDTVKESIRAYGYVDGTQYNCIIFPLVIQDMIYSDIILWEINKPITEEDYSLMERSLPFISMEILENKMAFEIESKYKNQLFEEIMGGEINSISAVINKGKIYNWDLTKDYIPILVNFTKPLARNEAEYVYYLLSKKISRDNDKHIVGLKDNDIVILYEITGKIDDDGYKKDISLFYKWINEALEKRYDVYLTIGGFYNSIDKLYKSYNEAKTISKLCQKMNSKRDIYYFDELILQKIIYDFKDDINIKKLYSQTVHVLEDYDNKKNTELLKTLKVYLDNNSNLELSAKELFVHINTMKYRIDKIEKLTNTSLHTVEGLVAFFICMQVHEYYYNLF